MSDLLTTPEARAIGYALIHFLWQGVAIGAGGAIALATLRRSSPQARYLVACVVLAAMAVAPLVTAARLLGAERPPTITATTAATPPAPIDAVLVAAPPIDAAADTDWIAAALPWVVTVWMAGVLVLGLHLLHAWLRVGRLRRSGRPLSDTRWPAVVADLAARLGVARPVMLVESAVLAVPAVIGWIRPAIVIPASALAGLSPSQLEAILAHEIAHIRRADYLVNAIQCAIETLLFYHPAVWWISKRIRAERELCCDEIAAALCEDRVAYARALVSLEELRAAPPLAVAAGGGDLLARVRRLVDQDSPSSSRWSGGLGMTLLLTAVFVAATGQFHAMSSGAVTPPLPPAPIVEAQPKPDAAPSPKSSAPVAAPVTASRQRGAQAPPTTTQGRATISGQVLDQLRGTIPGATVTLNRLSATDSRRTVTNALGHFVFENIEAGIYDVTVSMTGFKTARHRMSIGADQKAVSEILLEVGSVVESVTVVGRRPSSTQTPPTPPAAAPSGLAADYFDAAKMYYQQGRYAEAEAMTTRALELVRAAAPMLATTPGVVSSPGGPVRVGGSIREPNKIRHIAPVYPPIAQAAGVSGVVIIEATIATDGSVRDARVLRSLPLLDAAALDAVRQWVYTPTLLNNQPVEVVMTVTVTFEMR